MNNQGPDGKPEPNDRGPKTTADDGKPVARKNKEKVTPGEEEPVEVVMVKEVPGKSTRVSKGQKAGPSDCSPAAGHPAAEGIAAAAAKSSGTASGNVFHSLEKDQIKWISGQLQAIVEANQDFPQKFKQRLVSESSRVENPFKFIAALVNEGMLCDGSSDLDPHYGFKEMLVQLAVTIIGCSEGADGTVGLVKALESSGNLKLLSALWTWTKDDLGMKTDDDSGLSEAEGITSSLPSPPRQKLRSDVASPAEFRSSGAKLMDKIMSHMQEDGFMEQLEAHLLSKASHIVHAPEFFNSLLRQNVLEETDVQPANGPQIQEAQQIERVINVACSKRAIGSLVLALQSSGNELILLETSAWLETLQTRKNNQSIAAVADAEGNDSVDDDHGEPDDSFKSVTRSAGELVASNDIALRKILEHFSHSELLKLSLVTKLWKEAARSLMLKRGNILAQLTCNENHPTCIDLQGFAAVLKTMKTVPFSIIHVNIGGRESCRATAQDPHGTIDAILAKLAVRKASVRLGRFLNDDRCGDKDCFGVLLAKKLLQDLGGTLEKLTLVHSYPEKCTAGQDLMEQMAENWSFPSLKILKLWDHYNSPPDRYYNYLRALLSRAPNLVTLDTRESLNFDETILGSNSTVEWLVQDDVKYPWQEIPENLIANIRLVNLLLSDDVFDSTSDFDDFNRKMPRLLQTCCTTTLQQVQLGVKFAIPLMAYGVCFENVGDLLMGVDFDNLRRYQPAVLEIVKNFDFTSIFPRLSSVDVYNENRNDNGPLPDSFQRFLEHTRFQEAKWNRADNIKEMELIADLGLDTHSYQFLAQMFPCVQRLEFFDSENQSDIHLVGQSWLGLKDLIFWFSGNANLDSIICGLDTEEVAVLRTKNDDYLKTVEVVPVRSGITCMKNLRTLTLMEDGGPQESALTMTKVSGLLAFSRCPNLQVYFQGCSRTCQALNHMAPYVQFDEF